MTCDDVLVEKVIMCRRQTVRKRSIQSQVSAATLLLRFCSPQTQFVELKYLHSDLDACTGYHRKIEVLLTKITIINFSKFINSFKAIAKRESRHACKTALAMDVEY